MAGPAPRQPQTAPGDAPWSAVGEQLLNLIFNRFGLGRRVPKLMAEVRAAKPADTAAWEAHVRDRYGESVFAELRSKGMAGRDQLLARLMALTPEAMEAYARHVVVERTFAGWRRELDAAVAALDTITGVTFEPAPAEWDGPYAVDFVARLAGGPLGVQIKPPSFLTESAAAPALRSQLAAAHAAFATATGGEAFTVVYGSATKREPEQIHNPEVLAQLSAAAARLRAPRATLAP